MSVRVDLIWLTAGELNHLGEGGTVRRTTDNGAAIWFHGEETAETQPQGTWAIPVGEFMTGQLRSGGTSGYTHKDYPFVLDIRLSA